jgi:hypothetical protein
MTARSRKSDVPEVRRRTGGERHGRLDPVPDVDRAPEHHCVVVAEPVDIIDVDDIKRPGTLW